MKEPNRKIIYLHGFNSASKPDSPKLQSLAKLGEVVTLDYNSFDSYPKILEQLGKRFQETIRSSPDVDWAVAGTSLGGFWAATLGSKYGIPAILINPAINPSKTMQLAVGEKLQNYVTGEENTLTEEVVISYPVIPNKGAHLILLDKADEVLDPAKTANYYHNYKVVQFDGGSHSFDHMEESLPHIQQFFNHVDVVFGLVEG